MSKVLDAPSQEVTAAVDMVLVLSVVLGTKLGREPLRTVLEGASPLSPSQRTILICIEVRNSNASANQALLSIEIQAIATSPKVPLGMVRSEG